MVFVELGGNIAKLQGYKWQCKESSSMEEMLDSMVDLHCPPSSDPHPEGTLARSIMEILGGEVVFDSGPSGQHGLVVDTISSLESVDIEPFLKARGLKHGTSSAFDLAWQKAVKNGTITLESAFAVLADVIANADAENSTSAHASHLAEAITQTN